MSFVENRKGIGQVALSSADLLRALEDRAEQIADRARDLAQSDAFDTGTYRDSIEVVKGPDTDRANVLVLADVDYAINVEFGNGNSPGYRILGRAADAGS